MDPAERLTEDDRGQAAADQFLARALAAHQIAASRPVAPPSVPGLCRNCLEECGAIYCGEECRVDHDRRRAAVARRSGADPRWTSAQ